MGFHFVPNLLFFYSLSMLQVVTISSEEGSSCQQHTDRKKYRNPRGSHLSHIGRPDLGWPSDLSWGVKRIGLISTAEGLNEGGRASAVAGRMLCEWGWGLLNNLFASSFSCVHVWHGNSYWIWCASVHAESRDVLRVVNIEHSRFRWWKMLPSQWYLYGEGRFCAYILMHEWAFLLLCGILSENRKKAHLIRLNVQFLLYTNILFVFSTYGAFQQTLLIVCNLVTQSFFFFSDQLLSRFMNYISCFICLLRWF